MVCKFCKVDKPQDCFYTYKNPGQENIHYRKMCKVCFSKREDDRYWAKKGKVKESIISLPRGPKIAPKSFTEEKQFCKGCQMDLPLSSFYIHHQTNTIYTKCKDCHNRRARKSAYDNMDYRSEPGEWISEEQRDIVFDILKKIGWSYNSIQNIWYKIPEDKSKIYKDKSGKWINILNKKKKISNRGANRPRLNLPMNEIMKMIYEGQPYKVIAAKFNCSDTTIVNRVTEYYKKQK